MARTHENETDQDAWLAAAVTRKYRVQDGQVMLYSGGKLFPAPAPVGFAGLAPAIRPLVAQALLQFVQNRVGQKAGSGTSAVDAAVKAIAEGEVSNAQNNDAFEAAYRAGIAARVEDRLGELPEGATKEEKAERATIIDGTAVKNRDKLFDIIVAEATAAGQEAGTASGKTRKAKAASTEKAIDLD